MSRTYSQEWFDTFLPSSSPPPVGPEIPFIERHLPPRAFTRVLDVACGVGRHAAPLADLGYDVLGIDISEDAVAAARERAPGAEFLVHDMRDLDALEGDRDGVLCLWQSFGGFSEGENRGVLGGMARTLRPGGRLLLDVYNRDALSALSPEEVVVRGVREVVTRRAVVDRRYRVELRYRGSDVVDEFDWEVFTPGELVEAASGHGFDHVLTCAWFDDATAAGPEHVRMQLLFERRGERRPGSGERRPR